jgi:hypothetical protein
MLAQYEMDDGALTAAQFDQIKQQVLKGKNSSVRTQLLIVGNELETRPDSTRRSSGLTSGRHATGAMPR